MGTRIEDISLFGEYSQPENRVTAALLQILKVGGEPLIREVSRVFGFQLPTSEVSITSQAGGAGYDSIPDGLLRSEFAFSLFIESKVKPNAVGVVQLDNHCRLLSTPHAFLTYVTPEEVRPAVLTAERYANVYWASWRQVSECLTGYVENPKVGSRELLEFLIEHFNTLLTNMNLLGAVWPSPDPHQVLIVAGSWAEDLALKHQIYICQNRRKFRPSKYLAFYNNSQITYVFEISSPPIDDCDVTQLPEFRDFVEELNPHHGPRRLFRLGPFFKVGPIKNDSTDWHGDACPYSYGQPRYTTVEKVRQAIVTSQL